MPINYHISFVCNIFCIKLIHKFLSNVLLIHTQALPYSFHTYMKKMPCSDIITTEHIQSYIHFLHPSILFLSIILRRLQILRYILRLPIYTDIRIFSGKLQHICIPVCWQLSNYSYANLQFFTHATLFICPEYCNKLLLQIISFFLHIAGNS